MVKGGGRGLRTGLVNWGGGGGGKGRGWRKGVMNGGRGREGG